MGDKETSGEDLIDQKDPYPDGNPEQMTLKPAKISETGPSAYIEIMEQQDSAPAAQDKYLLLCVIGVVSVFVVLAFLIVFADAIVKRYSQQPPSVLSCPPDWFGVQGMCYYFSKEKGNWTFSQNFCLSQNAFLLPFDSSLEKREFFMEQAA